MCATDNTIMRTLGVILARAGSKGLPNKCVRPLLGRPLIEYTFDHALASPRLDSLVLTTDSAPAAALARERGIEVIDRPTELATDTAAVDAAARHAVEEYERRDRTSGGGNQETPRVDFGAVVLLYANIPLRPPGLIDRAIELLETSGASSVRTVSPVGKMHPDWMYRIDGDRMRPYRANSIHRRQDLEPLYVLDGAVAAVTREALFGALRTPEDRQAFLGPDRRALRLEPGECVDVDTHADLLLAEVLLRSRSESAGADASRRGDPHGRPNPSPASCAEEDCTPPPAQRQGAAVHR